MESKIISEEILMLHMVQEQEKLMSEMKNADVGSSLFLVRVMVRIFRYESDKDWGNKEMIYENKNFVVQRFLRWKWYFRYLQAREQVRTPHQLVQIHTVSYVSVDREKVLLNTLRNKLVAAKRDRTKIQFQIEKGKSLLDATTLFSYEDDPNYTKALKRLEEKQKLVEDIEAEMLEMSNQNT